MLASFRALVVLLCCGQLERIGAQQHGSPTGDMRLPINTTIGLVYGGRKATVEGTPYYFFNGIPYARAARFQDPEEFPRRDFPTVALSPPPQCPQWDEEGTRVKGREENCLHLSIYTRQISEMNSEARSNLPVLFIVSNKQFTSIPPTPPDYFVDKGIVVVTVSYRVGVFGFLSTGDSSAPGNYGLLDLEMALNWVQNNIGMFSGNPGQVTLLGQGAGAALVSYLLLNPRIQEKRMVVGAITMSGSPLCPWASPLESPMNETRRLASALDCGSEDSESIVSCLKSQSIESIIEKQNELYSQAPWTMSSLVRPVIDAEFRDRPAIPLDPLTVLNNRNLSRIPLVSGVTSDEGALLFTEMYAHKMRENGPERLLSVNQLHEILPEVVKNVAHFCTHTDDIIALIKYQYFRQVNPADAEELTNAIIQAITDILYNECQQRWATLYREGTDADVYSYVFAYKGRLSTLDPMLNQLNNRSNPVVTSLRRAVSHGDDLLYLFNDQRVPTEDKIMQEEITTMWAKFIQTRTSFDRRWNSMQSYASFSNYYLFDPHSREDRKYREDAMSFLNYVTNLAKTPSDHLRGTTEHPVEMAADATDYELIMWIMVGVAAFFLVACLIATVLFIRQKKKTTFVTR